MKSGPRISGQWLICFIAAALLFIVSEFVGASEPGYVGPVLKPTYAGPVIVHNSQFLYTAADRLNFRLDDWIKDHAPSIQSLRPAIDAWASRFGVHPRVLSAVVKGNFEGQQVTGSLQEMNRVMHIAAGLSNTFNLDRDDELAASRAVMAVGDALAFSFTPTKSLSQPRKISRIAKGAPAPLFGFLQPPWEIGKTWEGNGAHGGTGSGTRNSLDFADSFVDWGIDTSEFKLVATQSGIARIWSSCDMAVVHDNGWITDYYHVDNIQITNFGPIERNTVMANYADNLAQATCTGGASTGPHVHVTMTYEDQPVEVDEANLDFTAFSYHIGIGQFDNNCNRAYYTHNTEGRVCSYERLLLNNASLPGGDTEPGFSKAFAPATVGFGGVSTLTFTVDNTGNASQASSLAFTDAMPSGMTVATPSNAASTCTGGTLTAANGAGTISLSGATVAAGASCMVQVDVTADVTGSLLNTSGDLTSSLGNSGTASATLTVSPPPVPGFAKAFAPDTVNFGDTSTLTLTVDNTASLAQATSLAFVDMMPSGMLVATPGNVSSTCAGALTAVSGTDTVSLAAGSVAAGASCTVQVDVLANAAGALVNSTGDLTSSLGNSGSATDTLDVNAPPPPGFAKLFAPDIIDFQGVSTLTLTVDNTASAAQASSLAFTDTMPSGMTVASPSNAVSTCIGGTLTAVSGADTISFAGAAVAAGASCTIQVDVTGGVAGTLVNTTGDLTSTLGNSGSASDTLQVNPPPPPAPGFSKGFEPTTIDFGGQSLLTLIIDNSASTEQATALAFEDVMPSGMTVAAPGSVSSTCIGGTLIASGGSNAISLSGASVAAGSTCQVQVAVTADNSGSLVNTTGDLTSSLGNSGPASAAIQVNEPVPPGFAKQFEPATVAVAEISTLTFSINNAASAAQASALAFTDTMPSGMTVASPGNASTTCVGGTLTAVNGTDAISLSGASVAAGEICNVQVDVTAEDSGLLVNTTGDLTSSLGNSGSASDTLTVNASPTPGFAKSFTPSTIDPGAVSTLTFSIDNSQSPQSAASLAFTDVMPADMIVAELANATTTCAAGVITAAAGTNTISFAGGSVAASESCIVSVDITAGTPGPLVNLTGDLTSSLGNSGNAEATLVIRNLVDLAIRLTNGVDEVGEASLIDYAIVVSNDGPIDAVDAAVSVLADSELSQIQWTCEGASPGAACGAAGTGNISDTVVVPAGSSVAYVLAGTVEALEGEEVTVLGEVSAGAGQEDSNLLDNVDEDTDPVTDLVLRSGFEPATE